MSDIERLRKLAGIKPKPILTETQPTKKAIKESDEDLDKQTFKQRGESSGKYGTDELLDRDTFKGSKKKVKETDVVESTNEYELSIATDTFGQYKSKPLEPDFPADMGEKFSKTSAGESNDAIGDGEDGFGKEEGSEQPKDSGTSTSAESKPKETAAPEAKSEPKAEKSEKPFENYFAGDDSDDEPKAEKKSEEPKEDDEFSKKVKEAQEYYRLKHFVRSTIKESNDYAEVFMAAIKVLSEQAETLIVKYGANLSQMQEKQIAMDIAKDLSEGLQSVRDAARTHGAKGRRVGNTYTFEFTDTASALMFTNYLAETTESVSHLTQNRGFIEAKVRDFSGKTK